MLNEKIIREFGGAAVMSIVGLLGYKGIKYLRKGRQLKGKGFIVGEDARADEGEENPAVLIFGPAGMSKTTCFMFPNILDKLYNGSMVIFDFKQNDLYRRLRKPLEAMGYIVLKVEPDRPLTSVQINPFDLYKHDPEKLASVLLNTADLAYKTKTGNDSSPGGQEWSQMSEPLLKAILYYVADSEDNTLKHVKKILKMPVKDVLDLLKKSKSKRAMDQAETFRNNITDPDGKIADKLFISITNTIATKLNDYMHENIVSITEKTTLHPSMLLDGITVEGKDGKKVNKKVVLFYCCNTNLNHKYAAFNLLFINMIYDAIENLKLSEEKYYKKQIRIYLDEFQNCGKIYGFTEKLLTCGSLSISFILGIQDYAGIVGKYGKEEADSIFQSAGIKIAINKCDPTTVEKFLIYSPKKADGETPIHSTVKVVSERRCIVLTRNMYEFVSLPMPECLEIEPTFTEEKKDVPNWENHLNDLENKYAKLLAEERQKAVDMKKSYQDQNEKDKEQIKKLNKAIAFQDEHCKKLEQIICEASADSNIEEGEKGVTHNNNYYNNTGSTKTPKNNSIKWHTKEIKNK